MSQIECEPQDSDSSVDIIDSLTTSCDSCKVGSLVDTQTLENHLIENLVAILQTEHHQRNGCGTLCEIRQRPTAIRSFIGRFKSPNGTWDIHFPLDTFLGTLVELLWVGASSPHHLCERSVQQPCNERIVVLKFVSDSKVIKTLTIRNHIDKVRGQLHQFSGINRNGVQTLNHLHICFVNWHFSLLFHRQMQISHWRYSFPSVSALR